VQFVVSLRLFPLRLRVVCVVCFGCCYVARSHVVRCCYVCWLMLYIPFAVAWLVTLRCVYIGLVVYRLRFVTRTVAGSLRYSRFCCRYVTFSRLFDVGRSVPLPGLRLVALLPRFLYLPLFPRCVYLRFAFVCVCYVYPVTHWTLHRLVYICYLHGWLRYVLRVALGCRCCTTTFCRCYVDLLLPVVVTLFVVVTRLRWFTFARTFTVTGWLPLPFTLLLVCVFLVTVCSLVVVYPLRFTFVGSRLPPRCCLRVVSCCFTRCGYWVTFPPTTRLPGLFTFPFVSPVDLIWLLLR